MTDLNLKRWEMASLAVQRQTQRRYDEALELVKSSGVVGSERFLVELAAEMACRNRTDRRRLGRHRRVVPIFGTRNRRAMKRRGVVFA